MKSIIYFFRYWFILKKVIRDENIVEKLSKTLGVQFKTDWISRIYTVVNPLIENLNNSGNTLIYSEGVPLVERWLMNNLNLIKGFIRDNNLFDILTYDIKKLDDDENYLIRIYPIGLKETKKFFIILFILLIIVLILILI